MRILLFKVSSCSHCQRQEMLLKQSGINYIPCELFKNRELARKYGVTDVPTTVVVDNNNNVLFKYNFTLNQNDLEKLTLILQKM